MMARPARGASGGRHPGRARAIAMALAAAALFGSSTVAAKPLLSVSDPWLLAGLLYLGSGVGLGALRLLRLAGVPSLPAEARVPRSGWAWLAGAIAAGGVVGPVLLMFGLTFTTASEVALLLNLEGVFTAALAWAVFREHVDRRIALGMLVITAGAVALAIDGAGRAGLSVPALAVVGACFAWALDNNLTRKVAGSDPVQIAALKGLVAGAVNIVIALALGASLPGAPMLARAAIIGLFGYGVSLVLFVLALRHLGTARTAAYFSTAPFIGAVAGVAILGDPLTLRLVAAAALMAVGVALHLAERHDHQHVHAPVDHEHAHHHDEHHRHEHPADVPEEEPHSHPHHHPQMDHDHAHYPDIHHRHAHEEPPDDKR